MVRLPVSSSHIKAIGYDGEQQALEVEFSNGRVYRYDGVPPAVHAGLVNAESVGEYFHLAIRGRHREQRVG